MRPVLKYPGAKWRLSDWIIDMIPPHISYVEPYFGSGAIFFNKPKSQIETINDIDGEIVNFFRVCRDHPDELSRLINLTPWSRQELQNCNLQIDNPIERARRTAVSCYMVFGSRRVSKTFRYTSGCAKNPGPDNTKLWGCLPETITEVAQRLKCAQIENRPALEIIQRFNGPEALLYLDPPYVKNTRTLHGDQYTHEMNDKDHVELLEAILRHRGKIIISGYDNPLYNDALTGWEKHSINARIERGRSRMETVWLNFEVGKQLSIIDQISL